MYDSINLFHMFACGWCGSHALCCYLNGEPHTMLLLLSIANFALAVL